MFKQRLITVIATQLCSILITATIILADLDLNKSAEDAKAYGDNLTVILIMVGLIAHFRASKGPIPLGLIAMLGVFGPAYAYASGSPMHVAGYHLLALGFHGIILRAQYRLEHQEPVVPDPAELPEQPDDSDHQNSGKS